MLYGAAALSRSDRWKKGCTSSPLGTITARPRKYRPEGGRRGPGTEKGEARVGFREAAEREGGEKALEEDLERDVEERQERKQIRQEEREERKQIRQEEREERKREREKARGQEESS